MLVNKNYYSSSTKYSSYELYTKGRLVGSSRFCFLIMLLLTATVIAYNKGFHCTAVMAIILLSCISVTFASFTMFVLGRESLANYITRITLEMDCIQRETLYKSQSYIKTGSDYIKIYGKKYRRLNNSYKNVIKP